MKVATHFRAVVGDVVVYSCERTVSNVVGTLGRRTISDLPGKALLSPPAVSFKTGAAFSLVTSGSLALNVRGGTALRQLFEATHMMWSVYFEHCSRESLVRRPNAVLC
jgi:hypothetical protein